METLTLTGPELNAELRTNVGIKKVGWSGDDHSKLVSSVLPKLKDRNGKPAQLKQNHLDQLNLIFRPTEELQKRNMMNVFAEAGYTLDSETVNLLSLLFSAPQFATFLTKNNNPDTGKPFIETEKKRGIKGKTFASLLASTVKTESLESTSPRPIAPPEEKPAKAKETKSKPTATESEEVDD